MVGIRARARRGGVLLLLPFAPLASASTPAVGQRMPTAPPEDAATAPGLVVVSASRLEQARPRSPATATGVAQVRLTGPAPAQLGRAVTALPVAGASFGPTSNSPGNGGRASVNLRGLGASRTLVLLDGERMVPSDVSEIADLNAIPAALVERVDVISGGATTAAHGAIGGIVDVRLKHAFTGLEMTAGTGITAGGDGSTQAFAVTLGGSFDEGRGHGVVSASVDRRAAVLAAQREWAAVALGPTLQPLLSSVIAEGRVDWTPGNLPLQQAWDTVLGRYGHAPGTVAAGTPPAVGFNADRSLFTVTPLRHFTGDPVAATSNPANYAFNPAAASHLVLPLARRQAAALGRYALVPDALELSGRVLFTSYRTEQQLAAAPITGSSLALRYCVSGTPPAACVRGSPYTNPILLAAPDLLQLADSRPNPTANIVLARRMVEAGPRVQANTYDVTDASLALRGRPGKDWEWRISAAWGETRGAPRQAGLVSRSRYSAALGAPDDGVAGCRGFTPLGASSVNAGCIAALRVGTRSSLDVTQSLLAARVTGTTPRTAARAVQWSGGVELRRTAARVVPDPLLAGGDLIGAGAMQPMSGSTHTREVFAEVHVPLRSGRDDTPSLAVDLGFRRSDRVGGPQAHDYGIGLTWSPAASLSLRTSYGRATRAPNLNELFAPDEQGSVSYQDPCRVGSPERAGADRIRVEALCVAQGIPVSALPSFTQRAPQVRAITGGEPGLRPERADIVQVGLTWRRGDGDRGSSVSVDYSARQIGRAIGPLTAAGTISRCFNAVSANPGYETANPLCRALSRDASGQLDRIDARNANLGGLAMRSVDLQATHRVLGALPGSRGVPASLSATALVTRLLDVRQRETSRDPWLRRAGTISQTVGSAFPPWRAEIELELDLGRLALNWSTQAVGAMQAVNGDAALSTPVLGARPRVPAWQTHHAWARIAVQDRVSLTLGVDNVTDREPPIYTTDFQAGVQANTDPSTYDALGRRFHVGATITF